MNPPDLSRAIDFDCYGGMHSFFGHLVDDCARELSKVDVMLGNTTATQCSLDRLREMMMVTDIPLPVSALVEQHFGLSQLSSQNVDNDRFPQQIDVMVAESEKFELNYVFVVDDNDLHNEMSLRQLKPRNAVQQSNWPLPIVLMGSVSVECKKGSFMLDTYRADAFGQALENDSAMDFKHDRSRALLNNLRCAVNIVRQKSASQHTIAKSVAQKNWIADLVACMCNICLVVMVALFVLFVVV